VLVPYSGPFRSLLEALGVPRERVVVAPRDDKGRTLYYSRNATFVLRAPPFNILQVAAGVA
jgi:hypothetical protein